MHDIIQKKSKDRNVSYRVYITTGIQEIGVLWVGFEGRGGIKLNRTFIKADKMK